MKYSNARFQLAWMALFGFVLLIAVIAYSGMYRNGPAPLKSNTEIDIDNASSLKSPQTLEERAALHSKLTQCLSKKGGEIIDTLEISNWRRSWIDEPPGLLRGISYHSGKITVCLYVSSDQPLYRQLNEDNDWDYLAFLNCRMSGITFKDGDNQNDFDSMAMLRSSSRK